MPTIEAVETNLLHIIAVDNAETAIKTLGLHINNIDVVGAYIDDVNAVHDALADIATVKDGLAHINTVSAHTDNIDAVGRNIAAVQEVDRRIQLVIDAPGNANVASTAATEAQKQAGLAKQYADSASAVAGLPTATDGNDQQPVIWDKDLRAFGFGAPGGANLLPAPAITSPAQLPVGFAANFTLTGLPGLMGTTIATFQLQVNEAEIQELTATNNAYSGTITAQGISGAVWTIKARAVDSKGNVSLWNQTTAVLVVPFVNTPTITSPLSNAIVGNKTIELTCSAFASMHLVDTHKASRWIISTDVAGNNVLHDSGWRQDALITYVAIIDPVAAANSNIFAHVLHDGVQIGKSQKSQSVQLKTSYVLRPSVISPLLSTMVGTDSIEMTCSDFATYAGNFDTHVASRWSVTTDAEGNNALCNSDWTSAYLTEHTAVLSPLAEPASDLYLWVEQRGELLGESVKSTSVRVVTGSLQTPSIVAPAVNAIVLPTGFTVVGSAFAPVSGATDTMKALYVQVATDSLFTSKIYDSGRILTASTTHAAVFSAQQQGVSLYTRIRYECTILGISGYSEPVRSVVTKADTPSITNPVNNAIGVVVKPLITLTAYMSSGNLDTGANTRVQIANDAAFATIVYDSGELEYTTSHTVVTALAPAVQHFIRAQHKGALVGWSQWSEVVTITTGYVETPNLNTPPKGGKVCTESFVAHGSPFKGIGAEDTLLSVTLQVAKDIGFSNKIYDMRTVTTTVGNPMIIPTYTAQTFGTILYTRVKYEGNALGESEFSEAVMIVVRPELSEEKSYIDFGNYSFTVPALVTRIRVLCIGAGSKGGFPYGGGQSQSLGGIGGKGGVMVSAVISVVPGQTIPLTVGEVLYPRGSKSSFGTYIDAPGGELLISGTTGTTAGVATVLMNQQGAPYMKSVQSLKEASLNQWIYDPASEDGKPSGTGTAGTSGYLSQEGAGVGGTGGNSLASAGVGGDGGFGGGKGGDGGTGNAQGFVDGVPNKSGGTGGRGGGGNGGRGTMQQGGSTGHGGKGGSCGIGGIAGNGGTADISDFRNTGKSGYGGTGGFGSTGGKGGDAAFTTTDPSYAGWGGDGGLGCVVIWY